MHACLSAHFNNCILAYLLDLLLAYLLRICLFIICSVIWFLAYLLVVSSLASYLFVVKLQVQGPNLELTLLSHSNNKNKNPHLNFIREWDLVSRIKLKGQWPN